MEHTVTITDTGLVVDKFELLWALLSLGFTIAMVALVITAAIKLGWKFAGWIFIIAFVAWMLF